MPHINCDFTESVALCAFWRCLMRNFVMVPIHLWSWNRQLKKESSFYICSENGNRRDDANLFARRRRIALRRVFILRYNQSRMSTEDLICRQSVYVLNTLIILHVRNFAVAKWGCALMERLHHLGDSVGKDWKWWDGSSLRITGWKMSNSISILSSSGWWNEIYICVPSCRIIPWVYYLSDKCI